MRLYLQHGCSVVVLLQEYIAGEGGEETKHEMARHFELCDSDGDGYISFSQFLRWVELCDLNPEDHLQVRVPCRVVVEEAQADLLCSSARPRLPEPPHDHDVTAHR